MTIVSINRQGFWGRIPPPSKEKSSQEKFIPFFLKLKLKVGEGFTNKPSSPTLEASRGVAAITEYRRGEILR